MLKQLIGSGIQVFLKTIAITAGVGTALILLLVLSTVWINHEESTVPSSAPQHTQRSVFGDSNSKNHILSIPIRGVIVGEASEVIGVGSLLESGITAGYDVRRQLQEAAKNKNIHAVILDINSPGGTIYGAHAIAAGVEEYKEETDNPVYAFISGTAASGAYWGAVSADTIIADYGSQTGSIGVITGPFTYYDSVTAQQSSLLEPGIVTQNGIEQLYITAGRSKDLGNPYRRLTEAEIVHEQTAVNNEYYRFVEYVSKKRTIPTSTIQNQIAALMYENRRAIENKLIDQEGDRYDTYNITADKASLDSFQVIEEESTRSLLGSLLFSMRNNTTPLTTCQAVRHISSVMAISQTYISSCQ